MSAAYKCDRCGRLMEGQPVFAEFKKPTTPDVLSFDLCSRCFEEFMVYIIPKDQLPGIFEGYRR